VTGPRAVRAGHHQSSVHVCPVRRCATRRGPPRPCQRRRDARRSGGGRH
jgi:hypothetical protein